MGKMQVKSKIWLEQGGELCFGAGRARILRAVEKTGSLSRAAKALGLSYRHAWSQIRAAEQRLRRPLLVRTRGGTKRGGAELTPYARELMQTFEEMEGDVSRFADRCFRKRSGK